MNYKYRPLRRYLTLLLGISALVCLVTGLLLAGVSRSQLSASAADSPEIQQLTLTGKGSSAEPYEGYVSDSASTWVSVNTPCLFGGGNESESSERSYSVISFKVRVSGVYQFSVTTQTYSNTVRIFASLYEGTVTDGSAEAVAGPSAIDYNTWQTSTSNVFDADLKADVFYSFRIQGSSIGYDLYVRSIVLEYISLSERYPLPEIDLAGITDNSATGELGGTFKLPEPSSAVCEARRIRVLVKAPDGETIVPYTEWGSLDSKTILLECAGNYTVRYATPDNNLATRTLTIRVAAETVASDMQLLNALGFESVSNFSVSPEYGIGGNNQTATGSITLYFSTFDVLKNSNLSLKITGVSERMDNKIRITLDENDPVEYQFDRSESATLQTYEIGSVGSLNTAAGTRNRLTITGMTEDGRLTLKEIIGTVTYNGSELTLFDREFVDIYENDADAEIQGSFTQTTNGLLGFSASETSNATYRVNMETGGEYFVILQYSFLAGASREAELRISSESDDVSVKLDPQLLSTPSEEYDAYRITLPAGESVLTLTHSKGKGYFISQIKLSNDLVPPTFRLSDSRNSFDVFTDTPLVLPYGMVTDKDPNAHLEAAVTSDNAAAAQIDGSGTADDPFTFTASEQGTYFVTFTAYDSVRNASDSVTITVYVTAASHPVISVDTSPVSMRSGYLLSAPRATASFEGQDVSSSIRISLSKETGEEIFSERPAAETAVRMSEPGNYTLRYTCTAGGLEAYAKEIPLTVTETALVTADSATLSGGFYAQNGAIYHPGDNSYAQEDSLSFDFRLTVDGTYQLGAEFRLYSTSYTVYLVIDGGDFYRLSATGSGTVTLLTEESVELEAGTHTAKLIGGTVGGDAWLTSFLLVNTASGNRKIITADEIHSSASYQASGDVRYAQGALGRLNLNPEPTVTFSAMAQVAGWYEIEIVYFRTNVSEAAPLLRLVINGSEYALSFDAQGTAEAVLRGRYYLPAGENTVSVAGVSGRNYAIRSVSVVFSEEAEISPAVLSAAPPANLIRPNERFTVGAANVIGGETANIVLAVRFNGVLIYQGENKELSFLARYEGTYEIVYAYRSADGVTAIPLQFTVRVEREVVDEPSDNNPQAEPQNKNRLLLPLLLPLSAVVLIAAGVTTFLLIRRKRKAANNAEQDPPSE